MRTDTGDWSQLVSWQACRAESTVLVAKISSERAKQRRTSNQSQHRRMTTTAVGLHNSSTGRLFTMH